MGRMHETLLDWLDFERDVASIIRVLGADVQHDVAVATYVHELIEAVEPRAIGDCGTADRFFDPLDHMPPASAGKPLEIGRPTTV